MLLGFAAGTLLATGGLALANDTRETPSAVASASRTAGEDQGRVEADGPPIYLAPVPLDPNIAQYCAEVVADAGGQNDADTGQALFCAGLIARSEGEIDAGGYTADELRSELETTEGRR
jgi:hypothetical protein